MNINEMTHLLVEAEVRYWEDATVNGVEDTDGTLIPARQGDLWCPIIRLKDGFIENWVPGVSAQIHYKVCDAGLYYLSNDGATKIYQYKNYYVPNQLLCVNDNGYGDYIIFSVTEDGDIENWKEPALNPKQWGEPGGDFSDEEDDD